MKTLSVNDLSDLLRKAIIGDYFDCSDQYKWFIEDISKVVCEYMGGELADVQGEGKGIKILIEANDCVPSDGGIYINYNKETNGDFIEQINGKGELPVPYKSMYIEANGNTSYYTDVDLKQIQEVIEIISNMQENKAEVESVVCDMIHSLNAAGYISEPKHDISEVNKDTFISASCYYFKDNTIGIDIVYIDSDVPYEEHTVSVIVPVMIFTSEEVFIKFVEDSKRRQDESVM